MNGLIQSVVAVSLTINQSISPDHPRRTTQGANERHSPGHHVPTRKSCARVGSPGPDKPPHAVGRPSFRPDNCAWFRGGQLPKRPSGGSTDRFSPGGLSIQWGTARRPSPAANLARARTRHVGDAALRRRTGRRGRRPAGCARRGTRSCRSWRGGRSSAPPCACAPSARRSARRRS